MCADRARIELLDFKAYINGDFVTAYEKTEVGVFQLFIFARAHTLNSKLDSVLECPDFNHFLNFIASGRPMANGAYEMQFLVRAKVRCAERAREWRCLRESFVFCGEWRFKSS